MDYARISLGMYTEPVTSFTLDFTAKPTCVESTVAVVAKMNARGVPVSKVTLAKELGITQAAAAMRLWYSRKAGELVWQRDAPHGKGTGKGVKGTWVPLKGAKGTEKARRKKRA